MLQSIVVFVALISNVAAGASITAENCALFSKLNFALDATDRFHVYFHDNSTFQLAQTGIYEGVDGITEYVKFVMTDNPYIKKRAFTFPYLFYLKKFEAEAGICRFFLAGSSIYLLQPAYATADKPLQLSTSAIIDYSPATNKINDMYVYYDAVEINTVMTAIDTPATADFICSTLKTRCNATWHLNGLTSHEECTQRFTSIPNLAEGASHYIDGYTRGCRMLHSVFASTNPAHCNHISFIPLPDNKGRIKCQKSHQLPLGLNQMTAEDFLNFAAYQEKVGLTPKVGYKWVDAIPGLESDSHQSWYWVMLSVVLGATVMTAGCCWGRQRCALREVETKMRMSSARDMADEKDTVRLGDMSPSPDQTIDRDNVHTETQGAERAPGVEPVTLQQRMAPLESDVAELKMPQGQDSMDKNKVVKLLLKMQSKRQLVQVICLMLGTLIAGVCANELFCSYFLDPPSLSEYPAYMPKRPTLKDLAMSQFCDAGPQRRWLPPGVTAPVCKWSMTDTSPFAQMSDKQFTRFTCVLLWVVVISAGLGTEILVGMDMIGNSDFNRTRVEAVWKYAQFLFSLCAFISLLLAAARNALSLVFLVVGLWHFGFPHTIGHFYHVVRHKGAWDMKTLARFLDGVGLLWHHSAAAFLICVLICGLGPLTRHISGPIEILLMQHGVCMLKYGPPPCKALFIAISVVLEVWFEWEMLSNIEHHTNHVNDPIGVRCTPAMLCAHWLMFAAGCCDQLDSMTKRDTRPKPSELMTPREKTSLTQDQDQHLQKLRDAFNAFDLNGDGQLSTEEILKVLGAEENAELALTTEELVRAADSDLDGSMNFDELCEFLEVNP